MTRPCATGLLAALGALAAHGALAQPAPEVSESPAALPETPLRYAPPRLAEPPHVSETGKSAERPPTAADLAYDSRILSSAASAQGLRGPLTGGWLLKSRAGDLYALEIVERNGTVEGAWRDLRREGALNASGFIEQAERAGSTVTLRFADGAVLVLRADEGQWTGDLTESGRPVAVRMIRRGP